PTTAQRSCACSSSLLSFSMTKPRPPSSTLLPYTTLFRSVVFVGTSQEDYWNTFLASVDLAAKMFGKEAEAEEYLAKFDEALENRSEEHTSELQSRENLVCRLLLEKKRQEQWVRER